MSLRITEKPTPQGASLALYVHWPFCKKKCPYCDFNSHVREGVDHAAWAQALLRELRYWHARAPGGRLTSIFFGGGTPSLMAPSTVSVIVEEAQKLWSAPTAGCEITLEANPTSVEAAKFQAMASAGVNRVSMGVQSLRAESLAFLGREHSAGEALKAIELAAKHFARYSFDLIYALPQQTAAAWAAELREALRYARGHLSLYQLTIEQHTAFHHAYHVGKEFVLPDERLAAELYEATTAIMEAVGMPAYEISNYAAPGQESLHNLAYWRGDAYVGIGPGAHGRVDMDSSRSATSTLKSPERWIEAVERQGHGLESEQLLSLEERAEEKVLMGLRLCREGLRFDRLRVDEYAYLETLWKDGRIDRLLSQGMIIADKAALYATARGQLLLNTVIEQLLG